MPKEDIQIKNVDSSFSMPAINDDLREILITLYTSPVSSQSKGKQKLAFKKFIQNLTKKVEYIIVGDVGIEITWYTHEQLRYEASNFLDIDNISKVIIDAISGPEGILVDDCVVQHQSCTWIDTLGTECIEIKIAYHEMNCFPKKKLCFLHLGKSLYHVASTDCHKTSLELLISMFEKRQRILKKTNDYYKASGCITIQRLFVRNKLRNFLLLDYADFPSVKQ